MPNTQDAASGQMIGSSPTASRKEVELAEAQRTIVLIEDDLDISTLITEVLQSEGYQVIQAATVPEGIAHLKSSDYDLVLTDAFAYQGSAAEKWGVLTQIHRAARAVPMIICTAHRAEAFADYASHGFTALIEKPFDLDDLLALLARLLTPTPAPSPCPHAQPLRLDSDC